MHGHGWTSKGGAHPCPRVSWQHRCRCVVPSTGAPFGGWPWHITFCHKVTLLCIFLGLNALDGNFVQGKFLLSFGQNGAATIFCKRRILMIDHINGRSHIRNTNSAPIRQRIQYAKKPIQYTYAARRLHPVEFFNEKVRDYAHETMHGEPLMVPLTEAIHAQYARALRTIHVRESRWTQVKDREMKHHKTKSHTNHNIDMRWHQMTWVRLVYRFTHILLQIAVAAQLQTNARLPFPLRTSRRVLFMFVLRNHQVKGLDFPRLPRLSRHVTHCSWMKQWTSRMHSM